jgi:hypothetical protein
MWASFKKAESSKAGMVLTILDANGTLLQQYSMMKLRRRFEKDGVAVRAFVTALPVDCSCFMSPS